MNRHNIVPGTVTLVDDKMITKVWDGVFLTLTAESGHAFIFKHEFEIPGSGTDYTRATVSFEELSRVLGLLRDRTNKRIELAVTDYHAEFIENEERSMRPPPALEKEFIWRISLKDKEPLRNALQALFQKCCETESFHRR